MKLTIEKSNTINSVETWFRIAPPEGGISQWVDGRSAKEFARYMLNEDGKMPSDIEKYIKAIGWKNSSCICYPEMVTDFPNEFGTGCGRHHDALMVSNDWLIGVEAKVSESFDATIKDWLEAGTKNKDHGANRKKRICESLKLITGKEYTEDELNLETIQNLRYQLISATVGTILEAKNNEKGKACLLVIEFGGDVRKEKDFDDKVSDNAEAFERYLEFLGVSDKSDFDMNIKIGEDLTLWIKKIHIDITSNKFIMK
jgi:hypothetical protein